MNETIVVADAHLDGLNDELDCFLAFLSTLQKSKIHHLFILGDLFNIWLGTPKMILTHQQRVINALQSLRCDGIMLTYVEGNRDYFLAPLYLDAPFHSIISESTEATIGKTRLHFSHGDLVNTNDRQYRRWRAFSRSRPMFAGFQCLPRSLAVRLVHSLEEKFRGTNLKYKSYFPMEICQKYAEDHWNKGNDIVILGHFHAQHTYESFVKGQKKVLYTLPAWKETHTYLEIDATGRSSFRQYTI